MFFVLWGRERVRDVVEGRVEFVVACQGVFVFPSECHSRTISGSLADLRLLICVVLGAM